MAILLPGTPGKDAWTAVDRVQSLLAELDLSADPDVYAHEFDPPDELEGGEERRSRRRPAAPHGHGRNGTAREGVEQGPANGHPVRKGTSEAEPAATPLAAPTEVADRIAFSATSMAEIRSSARERPVQDLWQASWKPLSPWRRLTDIVVAGAGLVVLSPLFALVAIAVKLTSPGPVFFVQKRAGVGGKPFSFIKFRSMYVDADSRKSALQEQNEQDGPIFKIRNDPRLTPLGRLIRKTSIDELPQLYNVLIGDMTLIGPRPPTLDEVEHYEPWQRDRLSVPGGLTCIWQVSGRSNVGFEDWVRMDIRYALQRSPSLDLHVMSRTIKAVVTGRGAY
ncbi:MAG: sugar transferase [Planctomycetota bacterium]